MMRLQLALDTVDISSARTLLDDLHDLIDIVEIGTPFLFREGVRAVTEVGRAYPHLPVLADFKIMDAGEYEAGIAFEAGADIVTVLAAAHDATIQGALRQAGTYGKQVMADMIAVKDIVHRTREIDAMGVDYVCVHTATDMTSRNFDPVGALQKIKPALRRADLAVGGGVTPASMWSIAPHGPDIVIVGGYITRHPCPREAAQAIRACF